MAAVFGHAGCSGCKEEGCKTNSDCPSGQMCDNGKCVAPLDTDSADNDEDSEVGTGRGTDDESTDEPGTDSAPEGTDPEGTGCTGTTLGGQPCSEDCECRSGYCGNGFCCESGECCGNSEDCGEDLCAMPLCSLSMCSYLPGAYACGEEDLDGSAVCEGDAVCNGEGGCVPVTADCGAYTSNGEFTCDESSATERCYASCTADNQETRCAAGAVCHEGACVNADAESNGTACTADAECLSGHCGDGFCCAEGECCGTAEDCESQCRTVACGEETAYRCVASFAHCGNSFADPVCTGDERCDGEGNCVPLRTCEDQGSPYQNDGRFTCTAGSVSETCLASCDSNLDCVQGYQCHLESNTCRTANGGPCAGGADCASGFCQNEICCSEGTCCVDDEECAETLCAEGQVCSLLTFNCVGGVPSDCGEEHTAGGDACEGDRRCDGDGHCLEVADDCDGNYSTGFPYTCAVPPADPAVERRCFECESDRDCDDNADFCDGFFRCFNNACDYDIPVDACPEDSICGTWTCDEATDTCEVSDDPCEGQGTECVPMRCILEGETDYTCIENPKVYGEPCDDGLGCNGDGDRCVDGSCVPGPADQFAPCFDADPCTMDNCTENGTSTPDCANDPIAAGDPCAPEYHCFGAAGTCELSADGAATVCVTSEDTCGTGGCASYVCTEDFRDNGLDYTCETKAVPARQRVACGESVVLTADDFGTRAYFTYGTSGDPCYSGDEYIGMEAMLDLSLEGLNVEGTLTVTDVSPAIYADIELMLFQWTPCSEAECVAHDTNAITFVSERNMIVVGLDSVTEVWPPDSVTLSLTCVRP